MTQRPLLFVSQGVMSELIDSAAANVNRYMEGNFEDLSANNGWEIESRKATVDPAALRSLDGSSRTAEADMENAIILHGALHGMTPALACEQRIWARLTHVDCLEYCRARWLLGKKDPQKEIANHILPSSPAKLRDDHAIARLWWSMHIATLASPQDPVGALKIIARTTEVRMQVVERPGIAARRPLLRALLRAMKRFRWLESSEAAFRSFMIVVNRQGSGKLFEVLDDPTIDDFLERCVRLAGGTLDP